jgi:ABC-2 type transport system ATP-binding protein/nitrous oxidase accessory protein
MITIDHLTMRFGRSIAVDDVSLSIAAGQSVALWGDNGAGKTTIIRCVLGLLRYQGSIHIGPFHARRQGKRARSLIGYVPQELGFYDDLRVAEAIRLFARLKGHPVHDTGVVLAGVGLDHQQRKRVRDLSGGMKQRLALGIALLGNPPVLVLDEVTASLDACGRDEFLALLAEFRRSSQCAMLFASHRQEEVEALATRVITLQRGKIIQDLAVESPIDDGIDPHLQEVVA